LQFTAFGKILWLNSAKSKRSLKRNYIPSQKLISIIELVTDEVDVRG